MTDVTQDLQNEIDLLTKTTGGAIANLNDFGKRDFTDLREKIAVYFLQRSVDIAAGCVIVAKARLPDSLAILERSLLENLFSIYWVLLSEENAQAFNATAINELKAIAKVNIEEGHMGVKKIKTGEDQRKAILNSPVMKKFPKPPKVEDMAKKAGLGRIYNTHYRFMSVYAHGHKFSLSPMKIEDDLFASVTAAVGELECINLIVRDWIVYQKLTATPDIYHILNV